MFAATVLASCGLASSGDKRDGDSAFSAEDTLTVGFPVPKSGPFAAAADYMINGFQLYLDEHDNKLGGRKVDLKIVDTQGDPDQAIARTRQLIDKDVDVIVGYLTAAEGYAIGDLVTQAKVPALVLPASDDLTQRKRSEYVLRMPGANSSSQWMHPLGDYAYREMGAKTALVLGMDYAFPWEAAGGFSRTFIEAGGEVKDAIWTPIGAADYAPYLAKVSKEDPDVVVGLYAGADAINFLRAWEDFGFKDKYPLIGPSTLTDEDLLLDKLGEGYVTASQYVAKSADPAVKSFNEKYEAAFKTKASGIAATLYVAAQSLDESIGAVGPKDGRNALLKAILNTKLASTPLGGEVGMDKYGNPVIPVHIRKSILEDGVVTNEPIKTYGNTSQFWKYDQDQYLKQPTYDRDSVGKLIKDGMKSAFFN